MPYWCSDCRILAASDGWHAVMVVCRYPCANGPLPSTWHVHQPQVSSMKPHRDLGIRQATAWHMEHLLASATACAIRRVPPFFGPVEVDEAYIGGKEMTSHASKHAPVLGRGTVGKAVVARRQGSQHQQGQRRRCPCILTAPRSKGLSAPTPLRGLRSTDEHASVRWPTLATRPSAPRSRSHVRDPASPHERDRVILGHAQRGQDGVYHHFSKKHLLARDAVRGSVSTRRSAGHRRPDGDPSEGRMAGKRLQVSRPCDIEEG